MNSVTSSRYIASGIIRPVRETASEPISDVDYDKEFPLPAPHESSTCSKCRREYNNNEFLALALIPSGESTWTYPSTNVELAVRVCKCGNHLARRVV
jgi:hypothetical protein